MQRPDVTDEEIIKLILEGWSGVAIAQKYGFTDATVIHRVKRATGMKPSDLRRQNGWAGRNIPPKEVDRILGLFRLYDAEDQAPADAPHVRPTLAAIARETGHASETIKEVLKNADVTFGGPGYRSFFSEDQKEEIARLYKSGMSCPQLADEYGVSEITIRRTLKTMGVPRRPRGRPPVDRGTPIATSRH